MLDTSISPYVPTWEKARHYLSPEFLAHFNLSYYFTICCFNSHWKDVSNSDVGSLLACDSSQYRQHALDLVKANRRLKNLFAELNFDKAILNCLSLEAEKRVETIQNVKGAIAISVQTRRGRLWGDSGNAIDWIIALPDHKRLITVSSSLKTLENLEAHFDDEIPILVEKDISLKGIEVDIKRIKLPPFVSKCRVLSEGGIVPKSTKREKVWEMPFLYRLPEFADVISLSLKIVNKEITFEHLLALSHPTDHGRIALGQYYIAPLEAYSYEYEPGTEISQRVIKVNTTTGESQMAYISNKRGRKIERTIENEGEAFLLALVKQMYGSASKQIIDYKIVDERTYRQAVKIAMLNNDGRKAKYISLEELKESFDQDLVNSMEGFSKGDRVIHTKMKTWGPGTVLGLRFLESSNKKVARIDFQFGNVKEILLEGDYLEIVKKSGQEPRQLNLNTG